MLFEVASTGEEDHGTSKHFRLEGPNIWAQEAGYKAPSRDRSKQEEWNALGTELFEYSRRGNAKEVRGWSARSLAGTVPAFVLIL